jgi:SPP1 family predicted phage head-tail adaptor
MKYNIASGELDRYLSIEEPSGVIDDAGHSNGLWIVVHAKIPCGVTFIKGTEVWETDQEVAHLTTDFKIRYIAGITPRMRIVFEGENYDIKRVIEITRRRGYVIQAKWKDNK